MSIVNLKDVSAGYEGGFKMEDITLGVDRESFTGIIGPNGSGKTTLLKIISGIFKIVKGRVELDGHNIENLEAKQKSRLIAYVPSESLVNFNYTVLDITLFGRYPYTGRLDRYKKTDKEKARRALDLCGVENVSTRLFNTLSSGEKKKVLIARSLCQETEVLLLDEPAAHLDIHHVKEIFNLLAQLRNEGKTVITILHDINLASIYCDEIVVLKQGEIKFKGVKDEIVKSRFLSEIYGGKIEVKKLNGDRFVVP